MPNSKQLKQTFHTLSHVFKDNFTCCHIATQQIGVKTDLNDERKSKADKRVENIIKQFNVINFNQFQKILIVK